MPTLNITLDLECFRCSTKIQKIVCCIQEQCEFVIEKVVYEKDKVTLSGPFDANKLSCVLRSKAGRVIKNIEVVKPEEPEPKPKCKLVYPYPCPQPGAWPCSCSTTHCGSWQSKPAAPPPSVCQYPNWSSCHCDGEPAYMPPPCGPCPPMPPPCPPMPFPMIVCDDSPPYGTCAVM